MERGDGSAVKGTVTALSSMFSPEEAQGAVKRVEEAIDERKKQLNQVQTFVEDNSNLVKLVQRLPDQLHHHIMVPFGKAAFFPGRMVHANEFLVLLGDGYYADRTSKQTVDILKRRGELLESQAKSLKAIIQDMKAQASFFDSTAAEAAEGLVEIREDFVEEKSTRRVSEIGSGSAKVDTPIPAEKENIRVSAKDEEFAKLMARMDELEKLELAAEGESEDDDRLLSRMDELEKEEEEESMTERCSETDEDDKDGTSSSSQILTQKPLFHDVMISERLQCEKIASELFPVGDRFERNSRDELRFEASTSSTKTEPRGAILLHKSVAQSNDSMDFPEQVSRVLKGNENLTTKHSIEEKVAPRPSQPVFDSQKAFTGSIVERPFNLPTNTMKQAGTATQSTSSPPAKPVSRFKMQRK